MSRTHLSLFSGIGGIDLAGHWADFRTVAFVEQDEFCQAVLRKNFGQDSLIFDDVRSVNAFALWSRGADWPFLVSGGFPCQDVSGAGLGAGLGTEDAPTDRSGLWYAMLGVIRDCKPRYVLIENVRNLVNHGIDTVLGGLEAEGYTCWAGIMGAESVGAPHKRERVFIVGFNPANDGADWGNMADPDSLRQSQPERRFADIGERIGNGSFAAAGSAQFGDACRCGRAGSARRGTGAEPANGHPHASERGCVIVSGVGQFDTGHDDAPGRQQPAQSSERQSCRQSPSQNCGDGSPCADGELADASCRKSDGGSCRRLEQASAGGRGSDASFISCSQDVADSADDGHERAGEAWGGFGQLADGARWPSRPGQPQHDWEQPRTVPSAKSQMGLAAYGFSAELVRRAGRLRRLALEAAGNAVVPAQVLPVLRAIADHADAGGL